MSEPKPHLFISHATWRANENQRVTRILDCLFAVLDKEWDVFVDKKRLDPGVKWRPEILHRLSNAQAGIVLFDQTAVNESDWVKSEALIMCFRKAIDPDFQLIPVLLEGVTPDDEELRIYKPFQLGEITFKHDDEQKTPEQISKEIKNALNVEKAKSTKPFRGWMWEFEGLLLNIHSTTLLGAWKTLIEEEANSPADQNLSIEELRKAVVQFIHHKKPGKTLPALRELRRELIQSEQWETISDLIKAKWVDNESVQIVFASTRKPSEKVMLIYSTPESVRHPKEIVDRLFSRLNYECPSSHSIKEIYVSGAAGEGDEAIRMQIENEIIKSLGSKYFDRDSEENRELIRENLSDPQTFTFCYIPSNLAKKAVLDKLHRIYPELIFLVQVSSDNDIDELVVAGGKKLMPPLDIPRVRDLAKLETDLNNIFR